MGYKNREVEWKLIVDGQSMAAVDKIVSGVFKEQCRPKVTGCASDIYWDSPEDSDADFVRLRMLDEPTPERAAQITLKSQDKGNNVNRIEVDLDVSDPRQANTLLSIMLGDPLGQITKKYYVYFLENEHTTVSIYKIVKDKTVFVEVEGINLKRVKQLTKELIDGGIKFVGRSELSLFDVFVKKKDQSIVPIEI